MGEPSVFVCPICQDDLTREERDYVCRRGHRHNIASSGYVNLLVTHQRRLSPPGDSVAMVRARRRFLNRGYYGALRDHIAAVLHGDVVLDAGCGEGYYLRGADGGNGSRRAGIDIAKEAVRLASKADSTVEHAVASVFAIPVRTAGVDVVLSVFAPVHAPEFARVLVPGGRVVAVTPGPMHLMGLKVHLFEQPAEHGLAGSLDDAAPGFRRAGMTRIREQIRLDNPDDISALLAMTPYSWYVNEATRSRLGALESLETSLDFVVTEYVKAAPGTERIEFTRPPPQVRSAPRARRHP